MGSSETALDVPPVTARATVSPSRGWDRCGVRRTVSPPLGWERCGVRRARWTELQVLAGLQVLPVARERSHRRQGYLPVSFERSPKVDAPDRSIEKTDGLRG